MIFFFKSSYSKELFLFIYLEAAAKLKAVVAAVLSKTKIFIFSTVNSSTVNCFSVLSKVSLTKVIQYSCRAWLVLGFLWPLSRGGEG